MKWIALVLFVLVLAFAVAGLPWLALVCFFLMIGTAARGGVL